MTEDCYSSGPLSHAVPTELRRLQALEAVVDRHTIDIFDRITVRPHWRVLEIGAGAGSIARWLAKRCPNGQVTATDLDTRFLEPAPEPNLIVLRHDVAIDDFPEASFQLIHARGVLSHLSNPDSALRRISKWLAPGGWLVVEEPAFFPADSSPYPVFRKAVRALEDLLEKTHGGDVRWGRSLLPRLSEAGLTNLGSSMQLLCVGDHGPGDESWRLTLEQAGPAMVNNKLLSESELAQAKALVDQPSVYDAISALVSAWGQRPETPFVPDQ